MKGRICVLGAFSFRSPSYDGQTIKTRNILSLLQDNGKDVDFFDTQDFKYNKLSAFRMIGKVMKCRQLYYLPAQNNLEYVFPVIFCITRLFNTKIHYFVVGGWLADFLEDKPRHRQMLSRIAGIHCETLFLKRNLEESYGFTNVDIFPNFRINSFIPTSHHEDGKLKLVFLARIIKMKGLDLVFRLGDSIVEKELQDKISIDFYGPQQNVEDDIIFFNKHIVKYPFMKYYGPLDPSVIHNTLDKYDAMLLPTHFYTEGFPGSILDAYIAGIPVIVTKWKHATEFVEDGKTGIIIPFDDDGSALDEAVMKLYNKTDLLNTMKVNARNKRQEYSSERAWALIQTYN
jgi:glycosyltransferase involved in cell wall biosynthesis